MLLWDHHCVRWELHGWVGQLLSCRASAGQTLWHQLELLLGVETFLWLGVGRLTMGCGGYRSVGFGSEGRGQRMHG